MNPHDHRPGDPHSLHPPGLEDRSWDSAAAAPLVEMAEVSSSYGNTVALQNVSLKIWPGQFMAIVGPNGGGKTTLLRTILGMVPVTSGKVLLRGQILTRPSLEHIGYVPQLETIDWNFPITVEEVISMGFFVKNRWFGGIGDREKRKLRRNPGSVESYMAWASAIFGSSPAASSKRYSSVAPFWAIPN